MLNEQKSLQLLLSSVWPEWTITRRLGRGSYGSVYEIQRDVFGTSYKCALKVLHMEAGESDFQETGNISIEKDSFRANFGSVSLNDAKDQNTFRQPLSPGDKTVTIGMHSGSNDPVCASALGTNNSFTNSSEELDDFVRSVSTEIDLMMQLKGAPNIVNIEDYAVLSEPGSRTIMIRMELLESVDHYIKRCGPLSRNEVIRLGLDICSALEACEQKSILHRDIKPSNIFYSKQAGFKLGDFGISRTMSSIYSKMSMSGVGTIQFMAPEVYSGKKYNHTVDIYSLGIVLYTLMNNNKPPLYEKRQTSIDSSMDSAAERSRLHEANMRRLRGEPVPFPENANDRLGSAICMACNPDPLRRFQTAEGFRNALKSSLKSSSPGGPISDPAPHSQKEFWKRKIIAIMAIACLISIAVFFGKEKIKPAPVSYTILYEDESGNLLDQKTDTGRPGSKLIIEGESIDGFILLSEPTEIVLSTQEDKNVVILQYRNVSSYSVQADSDPMDIPADNTLYYNGHHYYIYDRDGTSWNDARKHCQESGGYLAVINDMDENLALFQYMKDNGFETAFFGLIYIDGNWEYLDGDTSDFRNWGINYKNVEQPNNYEKGDIHVALDVHMKGIGTWNDVRYGRTDAYVANGSKYKNLHTYICEWDE